MFRNEDDAGVGEFVEVLSLAQVVGIHEAAVIAGTAGAGSFVGALHLAFSRFAV